MDAEALRGLIALALIIFFVRWLRRRKKRNAEPGLKTIDSKEPLLLPPSREPLPGYDADGEELDRYIEFLIQEYSSATSGVPLDYRAIRHTSRGLDEGRHTRRAVEVIRESNGIIQDSPKAATIASRLDTIEQTLTRLKKFYPTYIDEALNILHEYKPMILTVGAFREIKTSLNKIASLKTPKAKLRHYEKIAEIAGEIKKLGYAAEEEVSALQRFCATYIIGV